MRDELEFVLIVEVLVWCEGFATDVDPIQVMKIFTDIEKFG